MRLLIYISLLALFFTKLNAQTFKVQLSAEKIPYSNKLKLLNADKNNFVCFNLLNKYIPDFQKDDYFDFDYSDNSTLHSFSNANLIQVKEENIKFSTLKKFKTGNLKFVSVKSNNFAFLSNYNEKTESYELSAYSIDQNLKLNASPKIITNGRSSIIESEDKSQLVVVTEKKSIVEYIVLDENLNEVKKGSVDVGYKSDYYFKNIKFATKYIYILGTNLKSAAKKIENKAFNKLFCIDVSNNTITEQSIITEIENIVQYDLIFNAAGTKVILGGLLSDKQNKGVLTNKRNVIHGVLYAEFDNDLKTLISKQTKTLKEELEGFCGNWNYTLKSLKLIDENKLYFISEQENQQAAEFNKVGFADNISSTFVIGHIFVCSFKLNSNDNNFWSFRIKKMSSESSNLGKNSEIKFNSFLSLKSNKSVFLIFNSNPDILNTKIDNLTKEIELNTKNTIPVCLEINSENKITIKKSFDENSNNLKYNIQTNNQLYINGNESLFILDNGVDRKMGRLIIE